jgi:hypothetical protein
MGTEGTADTILNGARITAQADQNLSNAIIGGFNNLSNSFRERTNIYQQMVNSTLKVKELEVDAWNQNRNLELRKRELDIREAENVAENQYKKDYLNTRAAQAKKQASLAPLVSAVKIEADVIKGEQEQIQKDLEAQQMLLTGRFFDKEKGKNIIIAPGLRKGTTEHETAQANIAALNSKLQGSVARGRKITDAATKMTIGVEPNSIIKDLWPDAQIKEDIQQNPDIPGPNPILPGIEPLESFYNLDENGDILSGKVPQENHPSPPDQEEPLVQQPKTNFGPLRANQNPTYDTREEYDMIVGELIAQAGEKEPFNINIAREYESRLDPKEREILKADRNVTLKDAYVAIGEAMANRYERNPTTDQEKVIERKLALYKGQLLSLGDDPKKVDLAVRKADLEIIKFRQTEKYKGVKESDAGNERTLAIVAHLQEEAERVYGNPEKIQEPVKKPSAFDEAKDNAIKVISSDGSFGPETKGDTLRGLANQFRDKFISPQKNMATGNPYPVNDEYVKFINSFDENPEAFGISKREENDFPVFGDMIDIGTPLTDKEIKALIKQRKEIILNDPEKAYAFWLEKERKSQTEGSRVFKFSK